MLLYGVEEVEKLFGLKRGRAYRVIKEINDEMKTKGYLTLPGKVNKNYLFEKFGFTEADMKRSENGSL